MVLDHGDHGVLNNLLLGSQLGRHLLLKLLGQPGETFQLLRGKIQIMKPID
jgi:hypothetical protein